MCAGGNFYLMLTQTQIDYIVQVSKETNAAGTCLGHDTQGTSVGWMAQEGLSAGLSAEAIDGINILRLYLLA